MKKSFIIVALLASIMSLPLMAKEQKTCVNDAKLGVLKNISSYTSNTELFRKLKTEVMKPGFTTAIYKNTFIIVRVLMEENAVTAHIHTLNGDRIALIMYGTVCGNN